MLDQFKKDIFLDEFSCARLSSDKEHNSLIKHFTSRKSLLLPAYLQRFAWTEDTRNYRAFYLVKEKNRIVCYFSLQCGLLVKCREKLLGGVVGKSVNDRTSYYIDRDKIEVTSVIPAVELAHFCVNDTYRKKKKTDKIMVGVQEYSMGVYVFYKYIAPIILELSQTVGVQYVYLFCADNGLGQLTKYYTNQLNFCVMDDMACIRPEYDENLECLTIKITDLARDVEMFEDKENIPNVINYLKRNETISNYQAARELGIKWPCELFSLMVDHGCAIADTWNGEEKIVRIRQQRSD